MALLIVRNRRKEASAKIIEWATQLCSFWERRDKSLCQKQGWLSGCLVFLKLAASLIRSRSAPCIMLALRLPSYLHLTGTRCASGLVWLYRQIIQYILLSQTQSVRQDYILFR
jgi:hypothetical protein